jgi:N-acetylglucosaminylphosphatidylinositol deacetylase
MTAHWDSKQLSRLLLNQFAPEMSKLASNKAPKSDIDILITFDQYGISSHANHRALYVGAKAFLQSMMRRHSGWEPPIKMYTLTTTNILRKYMSIFDSIASVLDVIFSRKEEGGYPSPLFLVSTPLEYWKAQTAMTSGHKSQMVWFRWGWITMSRYMIINYLQREKVR